MSIELENKEYVLLLNALVDMQRSDLYKIRKQTLLNAEEAIVSLQDRLRAEEMECDGYKDALKVLEQCLADERLHSSRLEAELQKAREQTSELLFFMSSDQRKHFIDKWSDSSLPIQQHHNKELLQSVKAELEWILPLVLIEGAGGMLSDLMPRVLAEHENTCVVLVYKQVCEAINAAPVPAQQVQDDSSEIAPWLTLAHTICTESGIEHGHIADRLNALRDKLESQSSVPDGYRLVPAEPTPEQQAAGAQAIRMDTTVINKMFTANRVYRDMLSAAPEVANER